ncbi:MAG: HlyD family efflux transporter periplasmic adaptor subunit [Longimicrobiaceae bacterium]
MPKTLLEESERRARIAELRGQGVAADGDAAVEAARLQRLEHQAGERSIRAPVDGRVGEAMELRPGAVVRAGEPVGSVVPAGRIPAGSGWGWPRWSPPSSPAPPPVAGWRRGSAAC